MIRALLAAMLCLATPALAVAAPVIDPVTTMAPDPVPPTELPIIDSTGYLLFKTLLALGIVVAVIYLTLNVGARRLLQLAPPSQALVQVVERVPLDAKKALFVVSAGGEYLLVGSTEAGLSLLSKLPVDEVKLALARREADRAQSGTFLSRLQALAPSSRKPPA